MATIQERVSRLEGAFEQVPLTLQSLQNQIAGLQNQIVGLQNQIVGLQNQIVGLQNQIDSIQQRLTALENRMMMMWLATMGTMVAGFITLFVAIMMRGQGGG
jgi:peptidoglycan hydrolase CwlO-like protein